MLSASFSLRKVCVVLVISLFIKGVTNVITMLCLLTYLGPSLQVEHRPSTTLASELVLFVQFFSVVSYKL